MDNYLIPRRFWVRVVADTSGCWLWIGGTRDNGYGTFAIKNGERWTQTTAHRFAYQDQVSEIPEGFEVDHLCLVRNCVRPDHLEAITVQENRRRRDLKMRFVVDTSPRPLPIIPPKPIAPPKPDRTKFCPNGHEYATVGKIVNGYGKTGNRRFTCAACREIKYAEKRNGNAAGKRTHCPQGHSYSGDNLMIRHRLKNGRPYTSRECRICTYARNRFNKRK